MPCQTRGSVAAASEGAGASPPAERGERGSSEEAADAARRPPDLLLAKHRVLQALGEAELAHALRGNLDGLARLGIATHARLAVRDDQLAEAGQDEAVLGFLRRQVQRLVED